MQEGVMQSIDASKPIATLVFAILLCSSTLLFAQAGTLDPTFGN
jgi:hypothetical protein